MRAAPRNGEPGGAPGSAEIVPTACDGRRRAHVPQPGDTIPAVNSSGDRIVSKERAVRVIEDARATGRRIVLCHGCFDLVHPGHVRHLRQAARLGDLLVVGVTADALVGKGDGRPLIPQELRAENLAALDCVSLVVISAEPTAEGLITGLRPDIYCKGREYEFSEDPRFLSERRLVESHGGRVVFTSGDVIFSSTALMRDLDGAMQTALDRSLPEDDRRIAALVRRHAAFLAGADTFIESFAGRRIVVAGESILDVYIACDRPDVAGEAPVMTLRPVGRRTFDGGAAIIARHLAALGARPVLVTPMPSGAEADALRLRLEIEGVEVRPYAVDMRLAEKQRYLSGTTKLVRIDLSEQIVLGAEDQARVCDAIVGAAQGADGAILVDFGLGFWTASSLGHAARALRPVVPFIAGDVSGARSNLLTLVQVDLLTPSEAELRAALNDWATGLTACVWAMLERTGAGGAIVTLGEEGCVSFERRSARRSPARGAGAGGRGAVPGGDGDAWHSRLAAAPVPALTRLAVDPLGCGDALLAAAVLARIAGATGEVAALVGSVASAITAGRLGNHPVSAADLRQGLARLAGTRPVFDPTAGERAVSTRRT